MLVSLEVTDDVDEVFQSARPCDRALFCDVADEEERTAALLCHAHERVGDIPHLSRSAGNSVGVLAGDGLHRVHDDQGGADLVDLPEDGPERCLGGEEQLGAKRPGASRAQVDLGDGLLCGDVEDGLARGCHAGGGLD